MVGMGAAKRQVIIRAPSILGLRPTGVELLPAALLDAGLAVRLGAESGGTVQPQPYDSRRDRATGMLNVQGIALFTAALATRVGDVLDAGAFPIVLGGDCSILLGNLLALRRRGRYGLLFIDGHADFYQPDANVNGEAASSELAFATGRGPEVLTTFDGHNPLVLDEDVAVVGHRDSAEALRYGSQPLPETLHVVDLDMLRLLGVQRAGAEAVAHVARAELDGFWIHLDLDVLEDSIMPAVDYRQPGGLSWGEARHILAPALGSGHAVGMDITIFNPRLDPDGRLARDIVDLVVGAFDEAGWATS